MLARWWNYCVNLLKIVCWLAAYSLLKLLCKLADEITLSGKNSQKISRNWNCTMSACWWNYYLNSLKFVCWLAAYSLLKLACKFADEITLCGKFFQKNSSLLKLSCVSSLMKILCAVAEIRMLARCVFVAEITKKKKKKKKKIIVYSLLKLLCQLDDAITCVSSLKLLYHLAVRCWNYFVGSLKLLCRLADAITMLARWNSYISCQITLWNEVRADFNHLKCKWVQNTMWNEFRADFNNLKWGRSTTANCR